MRKERGEDVGKADNLGRLAVLAALVAATTVPFGPVAHADPGPAPTRVTAAAEVPPRAPSASCPPTP